MGEYEVKLQNQPVDISGAFGRQANQFFVGERTEGFDAGSGRILWKSLSLKQRVSYHQLTLQFEDYKVWEDTPPGEYEDDQIRPFSLSFVTPRTVRLRAAARPDSIRERESLMLVGESGSDGSWRVSDGEYSSTYAGWIGSVRVEHDPLHFEFRDASGRLLTRTNHPPTLVASSTRGPHPSHSAQRFEPAPARRGQLLAPSGREALGGREVLHAPGQARPEDGPLHVRSLCLEREGEGYALREDPPGGRVN
jgi:alpha-D-xyloside xylohydrolase